MTTINVHFRKWEDEDVIALWNDGSASTGYIASYEHIGQHGDASPELISELQEATKEEYTPLLKELESIGYSVNVIG